jgi:glycosyltransferase involved in cell wall biosynthesis
MTGALPVEEISDWIATSEVYVNLSSRTTGFEPTMIEAMAQKKVIIGSEVSPIANIVEDGVDGFLIRPADTEALSHLLIEIFSGLLPSQDIGQRARDRVMNLFDSKKMVQAIEEAYRQILLEAR